VTGVGSIWSGTNVKPGDVLQIGNFQTVISDVTDTTHLVIPPWGGGVQSGVAYKIWQVSPQRFAGAQAMQTVNDLVAAFNTSGLLHVRRRRLDRAGSLARQRRAIRVPADHGQIVGEGPPASGPISASTRPSTCTGAYDTPSTTYAYGDVQVTSGSSYVYINATPSAGNAAPNATYWQLLAAKGDGSFSGSNTWTGSSQFVPSATGFPQPIYASNNAVRLRELRRPGRQPYYFDIPSDTFAG
jgi:hypothetical protein